MWTPSKLECTHRFQILQSMETEGRVLTALYKAERWITVLLLGAESYRLNLQDWCDYSDLVSIHLITFCIFQHQDEYTQNFMNMLNWSYEHCSPRIMRLPNPYFCLKNISMALTYPRLEKSEFAKISKIYHCPLHNPYHICINTAGDRGATSLGTMFYSILIEIWIRKLDEISLIT